MSFPYAISLTQEIRDGMHFENKIFNLMRASGRINEILIRPGEIFSFWHIIGNPQKVYKKSRSIISGQPAEEAGGGLCQLSGIIYHISLMAGLEIMERHNHSIDLYTDETRFTPLGTDATVVYGYKDLRIRNNTGAAFKYEAAIIDQRLTISIRSSQAIMKKELFFETHTEGGMKMVKVLDASRLILTISAYKPFEHMQ